MSGPAGRSRSARPDMRRRWRDERQFGRAVGAGLAALGAWLLWHGRAPVVAPLLLGVGGLLIGLSVLWPAGLRAPRAGWMALADALGAVSTRLLLGIVFAALVMPLGVARRLLGADPLGRRSPSRDTYWRPYPDRHRDPKHYEKMF